jgi:KEOPS complex subunit Cgi121
MMKKILRKGSQHSAGSGDYLATSENAYEIRQAVMTVDDRDACLRLIQDVARNHSAHIVCFDADKLAGREHAEAAVIHAKRSVLSGKPISNSFEMEALLFAAGSRQCSVATVFGIHEGENNIYVCSYPAKEEVWNALSSQMQFVTGTWDDLTDTKIERLVSLFGIPQEELDIVGKERLKDIILERIALLEVFR